LRIPSASTWRGGETIAFFSRFSIPAFDGGVDLGSPVSLDYFDRRPFRFTGKIKEVKVELK